MIGTTALILVALSGVASAEPLAKVIEARLAAVVPQGFGITKVFAADVDVAPGKVVVEVPGELKQGRPSIRVTVRGKTTYVPVQIGKLVEVAVATRELGEGDVLVAADFSIEARPVEQGAPAAALVGATVTHAVHAGGAIARTDVALAPPLARGTQVALEIRRGAVRVRGTATLEANARPGGPAIVRVAQTRTVVRGVLVAPATVIVGDAP